MTSFDEIKKEGFFASMKFDSLLAKKLNPPFVPQIKNESDVSNIDPVFTSEIAPIIEQKPPHERELDVFVLLMVFYGS